MCKVKGSYPVRNINSQNGKQKFSSIKPKTRSQMGMNGVNV
jgi:hypothetical protein